MSALAASSLRAQSDLVPDPDIRLSIDGTQLANAVRNVNGWSWSGEYVTGSRICSSPDVHLELQDPDLLIRGAMSWSGGATAVDTRIIGKPKIFTNDSGCLSLGLTASCDVSGCASPVFTSDLLYGITCTFLGVKFLSQTLILPSPLTAMQSVPVTLPPPDAASGFDLSFVTFRNGKWETFPNPRSKQVTFLEVLRTVGGNALKPTGCTIGQDPRTCDDPVCGVDKIGNGLLERRDVTRILLDLALPPQHAKPFANSALAEQAWIAGEDTLHSGDFAGVSIGPRFLLGDSAGSGIFQHILPVRIAGERQVSNTETVQFEVFLTEARIAFGNENGTDILLLSLVVGESNAWLKGKRDTTLVKVGKVGVDATATLPRFTADGNAANLEMELRNARLWLSTKVGQFSVCIEGDKIGDAGLTKFSLARYVGPQNLLPTCIDVGISGVTADSNCPEGGRTGRLSAEHPDRNVSLALDLGRAKSSFAPSRRWRVSMPLR